MSKIISILKIPMINFKNILYRYLRPGTVCESIYDIDYGNLFDNGIKHLFFDLDNTIIDYKTDKLKIQCINLFNRIKSYQFDNIIVLSNNSSALRVGSACKQLNVRGVAFACKPFVYTVRRIMSDYNMKANQTAIIGDQLFTDILLGNILKLDTTFVDPIDTENCTITKRLHYKVENFILEKM